MLAASTAERLAKEVQFVFKGTVQKLNATTMPELTTDQRTAIVVVDEIVHAPAAFANYAGKEITVHIGGRRKIAPGQQAVFFANGWCFGQSIAVRSIDHLEPDSILSRPPGVALAAAAPHGLSAPRPSAAENLADRELQRHVESADMVVSGRVTAVRATSEMFENAAPRAARAAVGAAETKPPQRISEHDPLWCEAVVEVTGVEKGHPTQQIVVRFPSSRDVRWHKVPKFSPGQEGMFILRKSKGEPTKSAERAPAAAGPATAALEVFAVEHASDFQPMHRAERIRTFIQPKEKAAAAESQPHSSVSRRRSQRA